MITASGVELRAGAQLLLAEATLRVGKGDRVGFNRHTPVSVRLYLSLCVRHDYWHSFVAVLIVGQLVLSGRT